MRSVSFRRGFISSLLVLSGFASLAAGQVQDFTFGSGGFAVVGSPTINEQWADLRLQPDGRILVAGATGTALLSSTGNALIARHFATGAIDTSFNGNGSAVLPIASAKSIATLPDGKILVAGDNSTQTFTDFNGLIIGQSPGTPADITIARLNANGTIDTSFGINGVVRTDSGGIDTAERIVLLPSGKFWVIGAASTSRSVSDTAWSIVAYNANGALDTTFGVGGRTLIDFGLANFSASLFDAALQGDNVLLAGSTGTNFTVARVNANGLPDPTFGTGGVTRIIDTFGLASSTARATSIIALPDGRLFAYGNITFFDSDPASVSATYSIASRLTANGQIDPTFNAFPFLTFLATQGASAAVSGGRV